MVHSWAYLGLFCSEGLLHPLGDLIHLGLGVHVAVPVLLAVQHRPTHNLHLKGEQWRFRINFHNLFIYTRLAVNWMSSMEMRDIGLDVGDFVIIIIFILAYSGLHINLQAHRLNEVYTCTEKKERTWIGRGMISPGITWITFFYYMNCPQVEKGHVRALEFRE